ncbi:MAG: radical SAM protein [Deltaproteobacteria bacterium]|nr:radical SAM protein [Deltaproteobacteria bacterium]
MPLRINEIFYSIQGESLYTGLSCVFVRLTGCNLRCAYCDTRYAYDEGADMTVSEILKQVESYPAAALVEITGGEPLLQAETPNLVKKLLDQNRTVLMETNGSLDISRVDNRCIRIMDVKCPSSRMHARNDPDNLRRIGPHDQIKFIMETRSDYDYALNILKRLPPDFPRSSVLFSPAFGSLSPSLLAEWILQDGLGVRLHLQLHKLIWPNTERGV